MIYKQYGNTGKRVSAVGFGGMRFDLSKSDEENAKLVLYAYEKGINFFDTAPGYSEKRSEKIYGIAFKELRSERDKFFVSTKAMPETADTAAKAKDSCQRSLDKMGLDYVDFFYVWCVRKMMHYELAMMPGGEYQGLLDFKKQGLIKHITISSHLQGNEIKNILAQKEFDGVLLGVNILNFPYRWEGVQYAWENGYGVVAMNPLAGGVIPQNEEALSFLASEGETATQAALRFCISCPQITVALNGFTTKEQIDMAVEVADQCEEFSQSDIDSVRENISHKMNALCTGCGYCRNKCPKKIPVPGYMQVYNDKIICKYDDEQMAKQYDHHHKWGILVDRWAEAKDCIHCHQCEKACTQHLNIIDRLEEIAKWEKILAEQEQAENE